MKTLNYTIIKLTFFLILGVITAHNFNADVYQLCFSLIGLLMLLIVLLQLEKRSLNKHVWFGLVSYVTIFALGVFSYNINHHKNFTLHYSNIKELELTSSNRISFKIKERLKPNTYYDKYVVELLKINSNTVKGHVLLHVKKEENSKTYSVDDILLIQSELKSIKNTLNPFQFNYKLYLEQQFIYHQLFTESNYIHQIPSSSKSIFYYADKLRNTINERLKKFNFKAEELAIMNALLLGQRQEIDRDLYTDYAKAGAIHILAVSGLHIGIILMMLNYLLRPLTLLSHGKFLKVSIILVLLWSFAIVAGLSASVTRAVTMFSIIAVAMHLKRQTNIYNTLAISMFIIVLLKPMFLFSVGFQMSYIAVFAIVSIQPMLYKLWRPKFKLTDYLWQIFTVTMAAQIGVLPISLFYFHQFPSLFFISNMLIIPFLGFILCLGLIIVFLALMNTLPEALANFYAGLIGHMNSVVSWVSDQDQFLFEDLSFDSVHMFATYLFIIASVLILKKFHYTKMVFLLASIIVVQGVILFTKYKTSSIEFVIFHKSRYSIIGEKKDTGLHIWHNLDSTAIKNETILRNYKVGHFIKSISFDSIQNVYKKQKQTLLIIDSIGAYNVGFNIDLILLRNSPKINLIRMIDSLQPKLIIADGSNYKSYVQRWKATCIKKELPFHSTYEKGAFILK